MNAIIIVSNNTKVIILCNEIILLVHYLNEE